MKKKIIHIKKDEVVINVDSLSFVLIEDLSRKYKRKKDKEEDSFMTVVYLSNGYYVYLFDESVTHEVAKIMFDRINNFLLDEEESIFEI